MFILVSIMIMVMTFMGMMFQSMAVCTFMMMRCFFHVMANSQLFITNLLVSFAVVVVKMLMSKAFMFIVMLVIFSFVMMVLDFVLMLIIITSFCFAC